MVADPGELAVTADEVTAMIEENQRLADYIAATT
jgi:hypothetical protein